MTVSGSRIPSPGGLDQALQLLEVIKDQKKYKALLDPLKQSVDNAKAEWKKAGIAGDVEKVLAKTEAECTTRLAGVMAREAEFRNREATQARDHSTKMAALRQRQQDFEKTKSEKEDDLASREAAVKKQTADLRNGLATLATEKANLTLAQAELEVQREDVETRFEALKEAFNG